MTKAIKSYIKRAILFLRIKNVFKRKYLLLFFLMTIMVSMPLHSANASIWNWDLEDAILNSIYAIVYVLAALALWVLSFFVKFSAWLVDVMLEPDIYAVVLKIDDPAAPLMVGWTVIRDFANTFFILILLLIAFSTILRIQKYSAKAFLPKFIIAIFLINFSALIAAVIIDFGQVFMYEIVDWMGAFGGNNGAMGDLTSLVNGMVNNFGLKPPPGGYSLENTTGAVFAAVFALIMGCVYIMLAGFLLVRLVVLAILVVLSPIAFLGIIMPGLSSHSGAWWRKIFEYSLFGPVFIFFVFLASTMASTLTTVTYSLPPNDLSGLSFLVALVVPYCVSIGMLLAVIPVTKQLGIAGSSALIGGTMGIGKIATGAFGATKLAGGIGKKGVGWAGRKVGVDSRKVGEVLRGGASWVANKMPGKFGKTRVKGDITLKEAEIKTKDRKDISDQYSDLNLKDMKGEDALLAAKGEASKTLIGTPGEKSRAKVAALVQRAIEDGVDMAEKNKNGEFKHARLISIAKKNHVNTDEIAKHDPHAAEVLGGKKAKEYYEQHAEDGSWKKYKGQVWENHYDNIQTEVNDDDAIRKHRKTSGKKMQGHIDKGAENDVANKHSVWKNVQKEGTADEIMQAKKDYDKAQGSAAVVTGDIRAAYGERDYDKETGKSELKKDDTGKTEVDSKALSGSIDKLSENFKSFNTDSKELFGQHAKGVSSLDLKGQGQIDIDALINGLKLNTLAVRQEAANMTILSQRLKTRGLHEEFIGKKQKDGKDRDGSNESGNTRGRQSNLDQF